MDEETVQRKIKEAVARHEIDGLMMITLLDKEKEERYVQGSSFGVGGAYPYGGYGGVYGYPYDFNNKKDIQTNNPFVGVSFEVNDIWKGLDFSPYIFHQTADGVTDRQSLGAEMDDTSSCHPVMHRSGSSLPR